MHRWFPFAGLFVLLVLFRVIGAWQGWALSPLPAFFLLSFVLLPGRGRWLLPLAAWVVTDPLLNLFYGHALLTWDHFGILAGLASMLVLVPWMQGNPTWLRGLLGSLMAAVLFYFVTNTISFFALPEFYSRSWEGFVQAQWTGPVDLGPTWVFLRNSCASNVVFAAIFLLALRPLFPKFSVRVPASELI